MAESMGGNNKGSYY